MSEISAEETERKARELLNQGQWFLAYDVARGAMGQFPQSNPLRHYAARAAISLGASEEAEKILEPLSAGVLDEETLGLLGRVHKAKWQESGSFEDARRCRDSYQRAYESTGGHWTCVNAMTMSWILGQMLQKNGQSEAAKKEFEISRDLARKTLAVCDRELVNASGDDRFWALASKGEAWLELGEAQQAIEAFEQAAREAKGQYRLTVSPVRQMRLLQDHGLKIPVRILELLKPPTVIAFTGHMIDAPGRATPRFAPEMEGDVRERIEQAIDRLDARIAFGSAACGADLLFIEALQQRGAEVNIVLPFAVEDFVRESVRHAGADWERRFWRALEIAGKAVAFATDEPYLKTVDLFRFNDQLVRSLAWLRAHSMASRPALVAVYDGEGGAADAGTAQAVASWPEKDRLHVIDLPGAGLRIGKVEAPDPRSCKRQEEVGEPIELGASALPKEIKRDIKTLLFADVVNFSKLPEQSVPLFMYSFLQKAAECLTSHPTAVETWGDAIFVVMDEALPLLRYAMALRDINCEELGLPKEMSVRIGLHAGPVFEGPNAMTGRTSFYGSHVNRAARIEPITLPGHIYASQSFVALLTDEQRRQGSESFVSEYLGNIALAKNFGNIPVYRVRPRRSTHQ
ncbi:MAG TPA: adenylate/guanylate cyclase domain-containing protein [Tepidisphaeraceae bacterium]|jgi:class 3 adenylate cyclase/tetratricopeptide (TPR) repeat protein|nr:adenylate/guanylate cyclase domain-containing protein [Tepidisphaeraceae bacterium]